MGPQARARAWTLDRIRSAAAREMSRRALLRAATPSQGFVVRPGRSPSYSIRVTRSEPGKPSHSERALTHGMSGWRVLGRVPCAMGLVWQGPRVRGAATGRQAYRPSRRLSRRRAAQPAHRHPHVPPAHLPAYPRHRRRPRYGRKGGGGRCLPRSAAPLPWACMCILGGGGGALVGIEAAAQPALLLLVRGQARVRRTQHLPRHSPFEGRRAQHLPKIAAASTLTVAVHSTCPPPRPRTARLRAGCRAGLPAGPHAAGAYGGGRAGQRSLFLLRRRRAGRGAADLVIAASRR